MARPTSLQRRLSLFLFLPVALLLIGMGVAGFVYARNSLLAQWREASILKLQRAAHNVDMRLSHIKEWIRVFNETAGEAYSDLINQWIVEQLTNLRGVARVNLVWENERVAEQVLPSDPVFKPNTRGMRHHMMAGGRKMHMRRFHGARIRQITPPRYDELIEHETVSLVSELIDEKGQAIGRLEVLLNFDYLIENVVASGWWQSQRAFLVNDSGKILAGTVPEDREYFAEGGNPLEQETLQAMKTMPFGTIRGRGHPPSEVSGFYKLQEAPWSLVMIAPGNEILSPIVSLRFYYFIIGAGFIFLILLLIRLVTVKTVASIRNISKAADSIARGDYSEPLPVKSRDEVGELTRSFNTMALQLEERIRLKEALDVAMEVQQNLLPTEIPQIHGLDIAGKSIYCDETGGDLYDFLEVCCRNSNQLGIAVGDVSGHGISAALLMATIRAFLRCRVTQPGNIAEIISDVNRLAAFDTRKTSQFMTLFYAEIDPHQKTIKWVRAGHDPAIFYDPVINKFDELEGEGVALGIDGEIKYQENVKVELSIGQIIVIGTDGLWETHNNEGEMFGKERLKDLIQKYAQSSAGEILTFIIDALKEYRGSVKQEDDVTLVVAKVII